MVCSRITGFGQTGPQPPRPGTTSLHRAEPACCTPSAQPAATSAPALNLKVADAAALYRRFRRAVGAVRAPAFEKRRGRSGGRSHGRRRGLAEIHLPRPAGRRHLGRAARRQPAEWRRAPVLRHAETADGNNLAPLEQILRPTGRVNWSRASAATWYDRRLWPEMRAAITLRRVRQRTRDRW
ncbi:MAG: hypothetical protein IPI51_17135 [Betaproteobacteria bacterium]|nr:hypothetical protein [Betaproteobacteria bacterium]